MTWITPQHLQRPTTIRLGIPKWKNSKVSPIGRSSTWTFNVLNHIYSSENFSTQSVLKLAVENVIPVTWEFSIQRVQECSICERLSTVRYRN